MRKTTGAVKLQEQYSGYGDTRPSAFLLSRWLNSLEGARKPLTLLLASEMAIDLAMTRIDRAEPMLNVAKTKLDKVVDELDELLESSPGISNTTMALWGTKAHLRLSELGSWRFAATRRSISNNYEDLLGASKALIPLLPLHVNVAPVVREFAPILLGSRALSRGESGWLGRLALAREDGARDDIRVGHNPNWDTGISLTDRWEDFYQPPLKFAVRTTSEARRGKKGRNKHDRPTDYAGAGIKSLYSRSERGGNFTEIDRVMAGCLNEQDIDWGVPGIDPMKSSELDEITARLADEIFNVSGIN